MIGCGNEDDDDDIICIDLDVASTSTKPSGQTTSNGYAQPAKVDEFHGLPPPTKEIELNGEFGFYDYDNEEIEILDTTSPLSCDDILGTPISVRRYLFDGFRRDGWSGRDDAAVMDEVCRHYHRDLLTLPAARFWLARFRRGVFDLIEHHRLSDERDLKLLAALRKNPRQRLRQLSGPVGCSAGTVKDRCQKLSLVRRNGRWLYKPLPPSAFRRDEDAAMNDRNDQPLDELPPPTKKLCGEGALFNDNGNGDSDDVRFASPGPSAAQDASSIVLLSNGGAIAAEPEVLTLSDDEEDKNYGGKNGNDVAVFEAHPPPQRPSSSGPPKARKRMRGRFSERLDPGSSDVAKKSANGTGGGGGEPDENFLSTAHLKLDQLLTKALISANVNEKILRNSVFLAWTSRLRPSYRPASAERFYVQAPSLLRPGSLDGGSIDKLRVANAMGRFAVYIDNSDGGHHVDVYLHNGERCVFHSRVDASARQLTPTTLLDGNDFGDEPIVLQVGAPVGALSSSIARETASLSKRLLSAHGFNGSVAVQVVPLTSALIRSIVSSESAAPLPSAVDFEMDDCYEEDTSLDASITDFYGGGGSMTEALLANCVHMGALAGVDWSLADSGGVDGEVSAWLNDSLNKSSDGVPKKLANEIETEKRNGQRDTLPQNDSTAPSNERRDEAADASSHEIATAPDTTTLTIKETIVLFKEEPVDEPQSLATTATCDESNKDDDVVASAEHSRDDTDHCRAGNDEDRASTRTVDANGNAADSTPDASEMPEQDAVDNGVDDTPSQENGVDAAKTLREHADNERMVAEGSATVVEVSASSDDAADRPLGQSSQDRLTANDANDVDRPSSCDASALDVSGVVMLDDSATMDCEEPRGADEQDDGGPLAALGVSGVESVLDNDDETRPNRLADDGGGGSADDLMNAASDKRKEIVVFDDRLSDAAVVDDVMKGLIEGAVTLADGDDANCAADLIDDKPPKLQLALTRRKRPITRKDDGDHVDALGPGGVVASKPPTARRSNPRRRAAIDASQRSGSQSQGGRAGRKQNFHENDTPAAAVAEPSSEDYGRNLLAALFDEFARLGPANVSAVVVARPDPLFDAILESVGREFSWMFTSYSLVGILAEAIERLLGLPVVVKLLAVCHRLSKVFQEPRAFAQFREVCRRLSYEGRLRVECPAHFPNVPPAARRHSVTRRTGRLLVLLEWIWQLRDAVRETLGQEMFVGTEIARKLVAGDSTDKFWRVLEFFLPIFHNLCEAINQARRVDVLPNSAGRRAAAAGAISNALHAITLPSNVHMTSAGLSGTDVPVLELYEIMKKARLRLGDMAGINVFLEAVMRRNVPLMTSLERAEAANEVYTKILNNREQFSTCDRNGARRNLFASTLIANRWTDDSMAFGPLGRAFFSAYFLPSVFVANVP